ncbi:ComF family protein [bacterium]|nr:ComF family protein [candidate division CSSED10-310 bacterium]
MIPSQVINAILDALYPRRCLICGNCASDLDPFPGVICTSCRNQLFEVQETVCPVCGSPLPSDRFISETGCICCRENTLRLDGLVTIGRYDEQNKLKTLILSLKHGNQTCLRSDLADLMMQRIRERLPDRRFDGICAVPLHPTRLWKRGYNQAALISASLSRRMGIPFYKWMLKRVRRTGVQAGGPEVRKMNVMNAFRSGGQCSHACLLLIDDVLTTGSTALECAGVLRSAGADKITVSTCAWVPMGH